MQRRPRRTKAEMEALTAKVAVLAQQGFGMTETARLLGEHRPIVSSIRQRLGLTQKRLYTPKPGDPERADRLLRALKEFWQQNDLEWPEIATRLGSNQPTLWGWFHGTRSPCEASLERIERFLSRHQDLRDLRK